MKDTKNNNLMDMAQTITERYLLNELYSLLVDIETQIITCIKDKGYLEKLDDIALIVPSLTNSLSYLRQIIILCKSGFPDGALILARNIYEQRIICSFILGCEDRNKHDELLFNYFQDYEFTRLKYRKELAERFKNEAELKEIKTLIEAHNNKYGSRLYNDYWWSGERSFRKISDVVIARENSHQGLSNNMHMEYKLACQTIHASCFGNLMNIGSDCHGIDMRPHDTGHENALFLAVSSLIPLVGNTLEYLSIDDEQALNELNRLGCYYFEILRENCSNGD